jgi:hypothetical protein
MGLGQAPAVVVIGGTQAFMSLARRYAGLNGWEKVEAVGTNMLRLAELAAWREAVAARLIRSTSPGECILILADHPYVYQGWSRRVMLTGRKVEIPLDGLTPVECLQKVNRWIARKEPGGTRARSRLPVWKTLDLLRRFARVLLEKHPPAAQVKTHGNKEELSKL